MLNGGLKGGPLTNAKQTIFTATQIQPLVNVKEYTVQVQAAQGNIINKLNWRDEQPGGDNFAVANSKVSTRVSANPTPNSAHVDALRT